MDYHKPVLIDESIKGLNINPNGVYVDLTFGGGGHSKAILKELKKGKLIVFDQDADAEENIIKDKRFLFVRSNFRFFYNFLRYNNIGKVDGILADLGVSSHHFDDAGRGFSFRYDGELDMRMDQQAAFSAKNVVNEYDVHLLGKIFREYGELTNARKVARIIVEERKKGKIDSIQKMREILESCYKPHTEHKFLAKVFQALRIEVNAEIDVLKEMLNATLMALNSNGRLVVLTYHSLEDRMVKNFMKSGNFKGTVEKDLYGRSEVPFKLINRKVIVPDENEIEINNRARSAKLRIAEKI